MTEALVGVMVSGFLAVMGYMLRLESRISRIEGKLNLLLGDPKGGDEHGEEAQGAQKG